MPALDLQPETPAALDLQPIDEQSAGLDLQPDEGAPIDLGVQPPPGLIAKGAAYGPIVGETHHDAMFGPQGNPLGPNDVALSPDYLKTFPLGSEIFANGKGPYRVADASFISPGRPNQATIEFRDTANPAAEVTITPAPSNGAPPPAAAAAAAPSTAPIAGPAPLSEEADWQGNPPPPELPNVVALRSGKIKDSATMGGKAATAIDDFYKKYADVPLASIPPEAVKYAARQFYPVLALQTDLMAKAAPVINEVREGLAQSGAQTLTGLTTPSNIAMLGSLAAAPYVGVPAVISRAVSMGFSYQSAVALAEELKAALKSKSARDFTVHATNAVTQAAFATLAAVHGLKAKKGGEITNAKEEGQRRDAGAGGQQRGLQTDQELQRLQGSGSGPPGGARQNLQENGGEQGAARRDRQSPQADRPSAGSGAASESTAGLSSDRGSGLTTAPAGQSTGGQMREEAASAKEGEKQYRSFTAAAAKQEPGEVPVQGADLAVGETVKIGGEDFKVAGYDNELDEVILEDGKKFGIQHVEGGQVIFAELERGGTGIDADVLPAAAPASKETIPGTRNIAVRITNAEQRFIDFAKQAAGLTDEQARAALDKYKETKAIKIDPVGGQFTFTHGGFAEPDVLRRAAGLQEAPPQLRTGEKAGELFQGTDQPFNLAGETGADYGAQEKEAQAQLDREHEAALQAEQEQDVFGFGPGAAAKGENLNPDPHLKQLTQTIGKDLKDPPPTMAQRFKRAFDSIRKQGVVAKDALTAAGQNARAAWLVVKNGYLRPTKGGAFMDVVKDWQFAIQEASHTAMIHAQTALKYMRDPLTREAIVNYIQADGDMTVLSERADKSNARWKPGYERAMMLTEAQKTFAANVGQYFDAMLRDGIKSGMMKDGIERYVTQIWAKANKVSNSLLGDLNSGDLDRNFAYAKKRIFDSYFEGEQAGFIPKHKDIAALITTYDQAFQRALSSRAFVKSLRVATTDKGEPIVSYTGTTKALPDGFVDAPEAYVIRSRALPKAAVTADGRPYRIIDHPALREHMLAIEHPSLVDETTGELVQQRTYHQADMAVHPDYYGELRRRLMTSPLRAGNLGRWFNPIFKTGAFLKQTKLSLSGFHLVQEGVHAVFHRTNPLNLPQIDFADPLQKSLIRNGLMVSDFHAMEMFSEGLSGGGAIKYVPGIGKLQTAFNHFLFRDYIPRLKMAMALHALERNTNRYAEKLSPDELAELTSRQANAAFGELNYRMMGRHPGVQDSLRLIGLAPDFFEARAKFVAQALKPYGQEQRVALAFMAATMYVTARILNQVLDGNSHPDKWFSVVYKGREYRLRTVMGDLGELWKDPKRFFYNRMSPWFKAEETWRTGRDFRGLKVSGKEQLQDFASWMVPITLGGTEPASPAQRVLGGFGVTNKPVTTSVNAMFDYARSFRDSLTEPAHVVAEAQRAAKETYAESDYRPLLLALQSQDKARAADEIAKLINEKGKLETAAGKSKTPLEIYFNNLPNAPFTGSRELEKAFFLQLDPAQRQQYADAIREREVLRYQFYQILPFGIQAAIRARAKR